MSRSADPDSSDRTAHAGVAQLDRRVAALERSRFTASRLSGVTKVLRAAALLPFIALPLLLLLQYLSEVGGVSFGTACLAAWTCTVLLWLFFELFTADRFRFSLARLLIAMGLCSVIFGFGQMYVLSPQAQQERVLRSIEGVRILSQEPHGPAWLRRLLGDQYFMRVEQVVIKGPGGDADIPKLQKLPFLRFAFLEGPGFTNHCLQALSALPATKSVTFSNTKVTREGAAKIAAMRPQLEIAVQ